MLTPKQIEDRKTYIGGSEIAALVPGIEAYETPLQVWMRKTGKDVCTLDDGITTPVYWGNLLEKPIAQAFADAAGVKLQRRNKAFRHSMFPWRGALIDRWVVGHQCGVEVKNRGQWRASEYGKSGTDECLDTDIAQCQWCMSATGAAIWYMAVLIGGNDFRWYVVHRNDAMIDVLCHHADDFWNNYVLPDKPPAPQTVKDCALRWPEASTESAIADTQMLSDIALYNKLKLDRNANNKAMEAIKIKIMSTMGNAGELHTTDGNKLVTWRRGHRSHIDTCKLREDFPDVAEAVTKTCESNYFRVY